MRALLLALSLCLSIAAQAQLVRQANTTLTLPAELPAATTFTTANALGTLTFAGPIDMASPPGITNRLFVVERGVGIQIVDLDTMTKSPFMDLAAYLTAQGRPLTVNSEAGLLSMAFHPNFNQNGYFYLFYSLRISSQTYQRVARFTATGTAGNFNAAISAAITTVTANPATESPLITQRDQQDNHNGGDMAFGPDGYLYISVGDEGAQYDGGDNARRIAKDFLGHILRIDVDSKPGSLAPNPHDESSTGTVGDSAITAGSYRIPPDNPFVALAAGSGNASYNGFTFAKTAIRTEIYSVGYRNPWRMSFDPLTGRLFVGDVGQDHHEEVDLVTNGFNAAWSWREGKHNHTPANAPLTAPSGFLGADPIYNYDHQNGATEEDSGNDAVITGTSITGGVVYRGDRLPELFGKYLFCDYNSGHIVALTEQANGTWTGVRIATDNQISGWGYDPRNDDALLCDHANNATGQIKRLVRSSPSGTAPAPLLSGTGAFSNLATLTPATGLVGYAPNVDFWSDHAIKSRWFAIKNLTDTVGFSADGNWTLPTNMVWVKHFDIDLERNNPATRRRLETRFLVKTATDVYGLSYQWNNVQSGTQTDAALVAEDGANLTLNLTVGGSATTQTWRFPSRTECRICHTAVGGHALSFNTRQMNRPQLFGAQTLNQISALSGAGYFTTPVSGVNAFPAFAPVNDGNASLEWRVRSYLAVNCVQCHQPGGASTGYWDARATTPTDLANLIGGPLVNDGGDPDNRWCIAGDIGHSMILKRLAGTGVQRMPPLGTNARDLDAEALLANWISNALPSRKSFAQWQTTHFGSTSLPAAQATANPDGDGQRNDLEWLLSESPLLNDPPFLPLATAVGATFSLTFDHPANRSVLVETSNDFEAWSLWNVPGNAPLFPATTQTRVLTGPLDMPSRFFRLRLTSP
jgi:glucose/arabinose dehydrogenase